MSTGGCWIEKADGSVVAGMRTEKGQAVEVKDDPAPEPKPKKTKKAEG